MFFGLERTERWAGVPRSPVPNALPRVRPGLYGGSCVRGSGDSSYRRIRRAQRLALLPGVGPLSAWRHWHRPHRWRWLAALRRSITLQTGLEPWLRPLRETLSAERLVQWALSFGVTALLLSLLDAPKVQTDDREAPIAAAPEFTQPAIPPLPAPVPELQTAVPKPVVAPDAEPVGGSPTAVAPADAIPEPAPVAAVAPEPQPGVADAVAQPFSVMATTHLARSLACRDLLCQRRAIFLAAAQAQAAKREAEEHAVVCRAFQSQKVVAQALTVGRLQVDEAKKGTLSLELYDSFESLERGRPDEIPDAKLFSVNLSGRRSEARDRYAEFVPTGGPVEVTNYGYPGDFTSDHNSNRLATGLGGSRPLIPGISAALSRALAAKLHAKPGAVIEFLDGRGKSFLVTYDDQSPQGNLNIDVYRPTFGSNNFCGRVRAARVFRQGDPDVSHEDDGLPFSLKNYRAALLQLALDNPFQGCSDAAEDAPPRLPESGGERSTSDFDVIVGQVPLARQLDHFANTPFGETGFATQQEITGYLQAGAQSLKQGTQLVRKRGLRPGEFPPLLRMRANLEAANAAQQAICNRETDLRKEYQACETELFRIKVRACIEEDPLAIREVRSQVEDLECTQAAILAQLEEQQGRLCPPREKEIPPEIRIALDSLEAAPDS